MKKQIISFSLIAIGAVLGASALSVLAAGTWSGPACNPPSCNANAPINVGPNSVTQEKVDSLQIDGSLGVVSNLAVRGNLIIGTSSPAAGYLLTAADSSGVVKWASPAVQTPQSGVPTGIQTFTSSNSSWTVPAGATKIRIRAWGGGGGGSSEAGIGNTYGSGGAGSYAESVLAVTGGTTVLNIAVGGGGAGGAVGSSAHSGGNGGDTTVAVVGGSTIVKAVGGGGGNGSLVVPSGNIGQLIMAAESNGLKDAAGNNGGNSPEGGLGGYTFGTTQPLGYPTSGITNGTIPGGGGASPNGAGGNGASGEVVIEY